MKKQVVFSKNIGKFIFDEISNTYINEESKLHWCIDFEKNYDIIDELLIKADNLYLNLIEFDKKAKNDIASKLINLKNESWMEYDEDDPNFDWDKVDAGDYNITIEQFTERIKLCDVVVSKQLIYCEYDDGDLFEGHRIHCKFNDKYVLIEAGI